MAQENKVFRGQEGKGSDSQSILRYPGTLLMLVTTADSMLGLSPLNINTNMDCCPNKYGIQYKIHHIAFRTNHKRPFTTTKEWKPPCGQCRQQENNRDMREMGKCYPKMLLVG